MEESPNIDRKRSNLEVSSVSFISGACCFDPSATMDGLPPHVLVVKFSSSFELFEELLESGGVVLKLMSCRLLRGGASSSCRGQDVIIRAPDYSMTLTELRMSMMIDRLSRLRLNFKFAI